MRISQLLALPAGPGFDLVNHGLAIDTIATTKVNPGATPFVSFAAVSGDSLTVRNVSFQNLPKLIQLVRKGATSGGARVRSPLLHDNIRGIQFISPNNPSIFALPQEIAQSLYPQDVLIVEGTGGAAETDNIYLVIYYPDLPGVGGRLHMSGDIKPLIANIKPIEVDVTNSATIGNWTDTAFTATENILKANTDYAVLGYVTDTAQGIVAIKGSETGNLRVGGPGTTNAEDTSDYFMAQSDYHGIPFIPVVNAANAAALFVSTNDSVASSTPKVTLILAQLSQNLPN